MNEKLLEKMGAFTFILLGLVILIGLLSFVAGFSATTFIIMVLVLILGLFSLFTGFAMWAHSSHND